jgi:hypothetical protein
VGDDYLPGETRGQYVIRRRLPVTKKRRKWHGGTKARLGTQAFRLQSRERQEVLRKAYEDG